MKKEEEIRIVDQIGALITKLAEANSYFKDDLGYHGFGIDDIGKMIQNIKSDFPISHGTGYRVKVERAIDLFKKRLNFQIKLAYGRAATMKSILNSYADLEKEIKVLKQQRKVALANALETIYSKSGYPADKELESLLDPYPDDMVIAAKLDYDYPLSEEERTKVKTALQFNP